MSECSPASKREKKKYRSFVHGFVYDLRASNFQLGSLLNVCYLHKIHNTYENEPQWDFGCKWYNS